MPQQNEQPLFASIVQHLTKGLYVMQDDKAVFLNSRFGEVFGFSDVNSLIGRDFFSEIYPDRPSADLFRQVHQKMLDESSSQVLWAQLSAKQDGTPFWLEVEAHLIQVGGRPAIFGIFQDQTDCQLIAKAMLNSQETLRMLLDAMEDRVYVVTNDYQIVYANRKMREAIGHDYNQTPCYLACRGFNEPCGDCTRERVFASPEPVYKEYLNEKNNCWYSVIELAINMPGSNQQTKLAVARDITNRKQDEQRIRALSHQLLSAHEDERKRLSRDLHDDLGQRLNAVKVGLDILADEKQLPTEELTYRLHHLSQIVEDSIHAVRQISTDLRPPALERLGLAEAIHQHCERLQSINDLEIDFKAAGMKNLKFNARTEIKLFRIVQEGLNNVIRHAAAKRVGIRLVASHPFVRLRITDDGQGFPLEDWQSRRLNGNHLGLVGMAERAELLNGQFQVESSPGRGTRLLVEIPMPEPTEIMSEEDELATVAAV